MIVLIENYRGVDIKFNTDNETFSTSIDGWDKDKKSYSIIKKAIDDYLKENSGFKSFTARSKYKPFEKVEIVGIRKDGRFIKEINGVKSQISNYSENDYISWVEIDNDIFEAIAKNNATIETLRETNRNLLGHFKGKTLGEIGNCLKN
jgi:hypothetical protein